jgi:hypothetical protein
MCESLVSQTVNCVVDELAAVGLGNVFTNVVGASIIRGVPTGPYEILYVQTDGCRLQEPWILSLPRPTVSRMKSVESNGFVFCVRGRPDRASWGNRPVLISRTIQAETIDMTKK